MNSYAHPQHGGGNVTLEINPTGTVYMKSQVSDYQLQGHALAEYNVLQFITDTYEKDIDPPNNGDLSGDAAQASQRAAQSYEQRARG